MHSLTMYNHLVSFDGCVADNPEAVSQWRMIEAGFSCYAMQTEVLGSPFKSDTYLERRSRS